MISLDEALNMIKPLDTTAIKAAGTHWLDVAKPLFSLGKLEDMITQIAGIRGSANYSLDKKAVVVMCADNGVVSEGVTQTGQDVTATVTGNFALGKASVCIMAKRAGADVFPVDVGVAVDVEGVTDKAKKVAYGTKNIAVGAAMTREQAIKAVELGINTVFELKAKGYDIIATGEMGIGNTTTSSAVLAALLDLPAELVTGRGAGLSTEGLKKKISTVDRALKINKCDKTDFIDVVSKVGGLDIAALAGVFIGGAAANLPVVTDGFISAVSALLAVRANAAVRGYMLSSHISKEPACAIVFNELSLSPVINADMCLGEGTGAVALLPLLDMAHAVYTELHTFKTWNGNTTYHILK